MRVRRAIWRCGTALVVASLLSFRPTQAQQASAATAALARDSITLLARGAWDGSRAAEQRSAVGAFYGGLASGVLSVWGLAVALPIANRSVEVREDHLQFMADTSAAYRNAFRAAYSKEVRAKRRKSALVGNLVTWPVWIWLGSRFGG